MRRHTPQQFAVWLHGQLTARGYVLDRPRGGGQAKFAAESGIPRATLSRILKGEGGADIATLERIADALNVRLGVVLVQAGVISPGDLTTVSRPTGRMTADEAADELGITDPTKRDVFRGVVDTLKPSNDAG